jgi:DHA2 family metal-tetracycline-proton antiporter-like MFS transporter
MTAHSKETVPGSPDGSPVMKEGLVSLILSVSVVLVIMNTMMFNLALPDVTAAFGLTASSASWIVTGYSIVFAISSITYSRLSDFVPLRRLFLIGILSLSVAAVAGYFSNSFLSVLLVRLVQASGAGSIPALSLVLIARYVPMARRGRAMATIMSAASLGLGLGPVIGGVIVEYLGWHFLFLVTAVMLALIPFYATLIPKEKPAKGSFDGLGALLAGLGTTGLLLFLTNQSWIALLVGAAALLLFALRIRTASEPFVLPSLFRNRTYLLLGVVGIAAYLCSFATLFLLPQILVGHYGLSAIGAGLVIFPGSLLSMLVSRKVGSVIDLRGNDAIIRYVPLLMLASAILFALFVGTGYLALLFIYILLSIGFTFLSSSISNEMSRILKPTQIGSGMGLFQLLQFFSGAFGVALTASALGWQKQLAAEHAYSNIYWGMALVVLVSILCAFAYLRSNRLRAEAA